MSATVLVNSLMVALAAGCIAFVLLVEIPNLARTKYRSRLSELRDDLKDATLAGRLPEGDVVVDYHLTRLLALMQDSPRMSVSFVVAARLAASDSGRSLQVYEPNMQHLTREQRDILKSSEQQVIVAVYRVLLHGSLLWLPIALFRRFFETSVVRFLANRPRVTRIRRRTSLWQIARDYVRVGRSPQALKLLTH